MRRTLLLLLLLAGCQGSGAAKQQAAATFEFKDSLEYRLLVKADTLESSAVGDGADVPGVVIAYRAIMNQPWAGKAFMALTREGGTVAQLYGLCGLYDVDRSAFQQIAEGYRGRNDRVLTLEGCEEDAERISDLMHREHMGILSGDRSKDLRGLRTTWVEGGQAKTNDGKTAAQWFETLRGLRPDYEPDGYEPDEGDTISGSIDADDDSDARWRVGSAVYQIGPAALPDIQQALKSGDSNLQLTALLVLRWLGPWAEPAAGDVGQVLADTDVRVRHQALLALEVLGKRGSAGRPGVRALLEDPEQPRELVFDGLEALVAIGAGDSLATITGILQHADPDVRGQALWALGRLGADSAPALPEVVAVARRATGEERSEALEALAKIGTPAALSELVLFLCADAETDAEIATLLLEAGKRGRGLLASALAMCSSGEGAETPALSVLLDAEDATQRLLAVAVLRWHGAAGHPLLTEALRHDDPRTVQLAVHALRLQGAAGYKALHAYHVSGPPVPAVQKGLRRAASAAEDAIYEARDPKDRLAALQVLEAIDRLVPEHLEYVKDDRDPGIREWVAGAESRSRLEGRER